MYAVPSCCGYTRPGSLKKGIHSMLFTSRFGALAARPIFPSITATQQEDAPELQTHDVEYHHRFEESAA